MPVRKHSHPKNVNPTERSGAKWISACAGCDRIREAEGWREPAFGELDAAQTTHDICPDCIRSLYPSYARVADRLAAGTSGSAPILVKQKAQTP